MVELCRQVLPETNAAPDAEECPIDISRLHLFTDGNLEEEKTLATLFLEQAYEMIAILQTSATSDKCVEWKFAAHRFKGASGNLGAVKLYHLCERAETGHEDDESSKLEVLMAIEQETQRVEKYFQHSGEAAGS
jgi:HPt (histidine-containing phosphotransfer) domain-containing protein